jgi:hypothetical protein
MLLLLVVPASCDTFFIFSNRFQLKALLTSHARNSYIKITLAQISGKTSFDNDQMNVSFFDVAMKQISTNQSLSAEHERLTLLFCDSTGSSEKERLTDGKLISVPTVFIIGLRERERE